MTNYSGPDVAAARTGGSLVRRIAVGGTCTGSIAACSTGSMLSVCRSPNCHREYPGRRSYCCTDCQHGTQEHSRRCQRRNGVWGEHGDISPRLLLYCAAHTTAADAPAPATMLAAQDARPLWGGTQQKMPESGAPWTWCSLECLLEWFSSAFCYGE